MDDIYRQYTINRIMEKSKPGDNGCRIWHGAANQSGYGLISLTLERNSGKRSTTSASRAMYMAFHNIELDREVVVCHRCDNPRCVNIEHLFIGSFSDNSMDMVEKGRNAKHYKPHTRVRKYSDAFIEAVRTEEGPLKEVSERYGVSIGYISRLRNGKAKALVRV